MFNFFFSDLISKVSSHLHFFSSRWLLKLLFNLSHVFLFLPNDIFVIKIQIHGQICLLARILTFFGWQHSCWKGMCPSTVIAWISSRMQGLYCCSILSAVCHYEFYKTRGRCLEVAGIQKNENNFKINLLRVTEGKLALAMLC